MARVIKSTQCILGTVKLIPYQLDLPVSQPEQSFPTEEVSDETVTFDAEQARNIIAETEDLVTELLTKARRQAQEIIAEAQNEAEQIRQKAETEAIQIKQSAQSQGFQQGQAQARQETAVLRQSAATEAEQIIQQAQLERERLLAEIEPEVVELALMVAKKVIHSELRQSPEVVLNITKAALKLATGCTEVTIRVHPSQQQFLEQKRDELTSSETEYQLIQIVSDPAVEPGGCLIDTANGFLDAQISQQVKTLEEELIRASHGV